ncbi:MAG TPA: hypothetical protein VD813_09030, partial [Pseudonocardia sp.]|nr:hypothetical protein [Pseudonocardia sp.]
VADAAAAAAAADVSARLVTVAGDLVLAVRAVVRDLVAQAVGDIVSTFLRSVVAVATGPPGVLAVASLLVQRAAVWAARASGWVDEVAGALNALRGVLDRLAPALSSPPGTLVRSGAVPGAYVRPAEVGLPGGPPTLAGPPGPVQLAIAFGIETGKEWNEE